MSKVQKSNKDKSKTKQFIIFGLCSFVALCLCMVTLVVTVSRIESQNAENNDTHEAQSKTLLENETDALVQYVYGLSESAKGNSFVKVNSYRDIFVDDSELKVTDLNGNISEKDTAIFSYVKNQLTGTVDELYGDDYTGVFGTVYNGMPTVNLLNCKDVKSVFATGLTDENGAPAYDENGILIDGDYYYITFTTDGKAVFDQGAKETFRLNTLPDIAGLVKAKISSVCTVSDATATAEEFTVRAKINRFTDELSYIEIERTYNVGAVLTFENELSAFGTKNIQFLYKAVERFDYFYAGVTLSEAELTIDKGEEASLSVNAVIEDDSEYRVYFESSDESVATVDEMGYVKGVKESNEPVIITVTLQYLGESFTDECKVYVGVQGED